MTVQNYIMYTAHTSTNYRADHYNHTAIPLSFCAAPEQQNQLSSVLKQIRRPNLKLIGPDMCLVLDSALPGTRTPYAWMHSIAWSRYQGELFVDGGWYFSSCAVWLCAWSLSMSGKGGRRLRVYCTLLYMSWKILFCKCRMWLRKITSWCQTYKAR